jgi:hypothetical protein
MELILHNNDIHIITMHLHAGLPLLSFLFLPFIKIATRKFIIIT